MPFIISLSLKLKGWQAWKILILFCAEDRETEPDLAENIKCDLKNYIDIYNLKPTNPSMSYLNLML